jgi:hypothetical protein
MCSRQRNARLEQSGVTADPDALLAALHAERESVEEEARRLADQEEDDALVAQYFSKIAAGPRTNGTANTNGNGTSKGKAKAKAAPTPGADADADADGNSASDADDSEEEDVALPALTIKRKIAPVGNGRVAEPTVASRASVGLSRLGRRRRSASEKGCRSFWGSRRRSDGRCFSHESNIIGSSSCIVQHFIVCFTA